VRTLGFNPSARCGDSDRPRDARRALPQRRAR